MIKAVEDAFTIIHIRISSTKILGYSARHFITACLIVFVIFNTIRVFFMIRSGNIFGFLESAVLIILTMYFCLMWIVSWPKAGKMLNKAHDYEEEYNKHHDHNHEN